MLMILLYAVGGVAIAAYMVAALLRPDKFLLLLEWDSVEAHAAAAQTPRHAEFRDVIGPFAAGGGVEHFVMG